MAHAALIDVFRPFRHEQLLAALGALGHGPSANSLWANAIGLKHGTFLRAHRAFACAAFFDPPIPNLFLGKLIKVVKRNKHTERE
jgi:hypothetical protein